LRLRRTDEPDRTDESRRADDQRSGDRQADDRRPDASRRTGAQDVPAQDVPSGLSASPLGPGGVPPRLVVLVDDFDTLVDPALGNPGRPAAGSVVRALEAVARAGARLGVHVIAATGRADRTVHTVPARTAALHVELTGGERGADGTPRGRGTHTLPQRLGPHPAYGDAASHRGAVGLGAGGRPARAAPGAGVGQRADRPGAARQCDGARGAAGHPGGSRHLTAPDTACP
ncbi:hypothetical protein KBZ21_04545, partial [Streptomyces sp. A73]|nr:hypothetical protein [Streptomyces sp. A73]